MVTSDFCPLKTCFSTCTQRELCPPLEEQSFDVNRLLHVLDFANTKRNILLYLPQLVKRREEGRVAAAKVLLYLVQHIKVYEDLIKELIMMRKPFTLLPDSGLPLPIPGLKHSFKLERRSLKAEDARHRKKSVWYAKLAREKRP